MESVACPLCCEDKFSNQDLLRYHLLSLTTNIQCPFCGKQCDDVNSLVVHLDKTCLDKQDEKLADDNEMIVVYPDDEDPEEENETVNYDDVTRNDYQQDEQHNDSDVETEVKEFIEEFTIHDSFKLEQTSETEPQEESHIYHCSECNINFPSIEDHIKSCHKDQEVIFQVTESENVNNTSNYVTDMVEKKLFQEGTWIKWGTGYFYTSHKDLVVEHLFNVIKTEDTTTLKPLSHVLKEYENIDYKNNLSKNPIDTNVSSVDAYSNRCITDSYGDRYFDLPIYLLHKVNQKVNEYFQIEARKLKAKKRIRLIRFTDANVSSFDIEQILFQNKPTNNNIIPSIEKATECNEYTNVDFLENCSVLTWKCIVCHVKSDHWTKLNKHNCIKNEQTTPKTTKTVVESKLLTVKKSNSRELPENRSQHICPHCNGEFDSEGYLRTHLMVHVNDSNKCPFCDQPIAPEMMNTHLIAHQNPEFANLKYLCSVCNKCYDSEFRLQCHLRAHEMRRKPREVLVCDVCQAKFNDKNSLKHHAITHIEPPERLRRLHECRFCGKTFVKPIEKVNHERVHTGEKPFACKECGRCFRLKDLVQKHMRVHTKERPYKCRHDGCEKTFSASSSRVNHEQGHSGIKQFKCYYCPRYFKNWVSRSNHVQEHMVQHKCDICDRSFVSFCNYKKHLKMHAEGRLKFNCMICRQAFGRQLFLDNHLNSEHKVNSHKGHVTVTV